MALTVDSTEAEDTVGVPGIVTLVICARIQEMYKETTEPTEDDFIIVLKFDKYAANTLANLNKQDGNQTTEE